MPFKPWKSCLSSPQRIISVVPNRFYLWYWKIKQIFHRLLGKKGEAMRWSRALLNTSLKSLGTPLMVGLMLAGGLLDWVYCWQDCSVLDNNWTHLQHTNCRGEDGSYWTMSTIKVPQNCDDVETQSQGRGIRQMFKCNRCNCKTNIGYIWL